MSKMTELVSRCHRVTTTPPHWLDRRGQISD